MVVETSLDKLLTIAPETLHGIGMSLINCVFRRSVTDRFGIVTAEFGSVTDHFGDVTDGRLALA